MAYRVSIEPLALLEIDEALSWYEKQLSGSGKRFLLQLDVCIDKIKEQPEFYLNVTAAVRRIILKSFPYKLLYIIKDKEDVVVIALIHAKRSNRFIQQRIK